MKGVGVNLLRPALLKQSGLEGSSAGDYTSLPIVAQSIEVFEKYSHKYDSWYERHPITAMNELRVVEALSLRGYGLEIGVGSGWFASRIGVSVGLDPSLSMLRLAKARGVEAVQGVGEELPFRDEGFDYVLVVVTLCFAEDPLQLLLEARRVLKKRGVLAVCIVPRDTVWGQYYVELGRKGHPFYSIASFYSLDETYRMMWQAGLGGLSHIGSLSYTPFDQPELEEPRPGFKGGFTCIRGVKPG